MLAFAALSKPLQRAFNAARGVQRSPRRSPLPCRASKGFGSGSDAGSSNGSKGGAPRDRLQDALRESRALQLSTSDMLAKLLQAEDPAKVAAEHVDSLTEEFFWSANAYMGMAQKEGNTTVTQHIETALRAALEAKQATLRPEIQLLNRLLAAETADARDQLLLDPVAVDTLRMNERYFFGLLERMQGDVGRQPDTPQKAALVQRLAAIKKVADAAAE